MSKKATKILVLTRGAPGAGKTTLSLENSIAQFVINPDMIRMEIANLASTDDYVPNSVDEREVWRRVYREVRDNMEQKLPVIIDATFQLDKDFSDPIRLSNLFNYSLHCIDFSSVPLSVALDRNRQRKGWRRVPDDVIEKDYIRFRSGRVKNYVKMIDYKDFPNHPIYQKLGGFANHTIIRGNSTKK